MGGIVYPVNDKKDKNHTLFSGTSPPIREYPPGGGVGVTFKSYPNKRNSVERAWAWGKRKKKKLRKPKEVGEGGGREEKRKVKLERTVFKPFFRQILSSTHARASQAII